MNQFNGDSFVERIINKGQHMPPGKPMHAKHAKTYLVVLDRCMDPESPSLLTAAVAAESHCTDGDGYLKLFNDDETTVACFAPGAWLYWALA